MLVRGSDFVAAATATTRANGDWGPVTLRAGGRHSAVHALGDDRDVLLISYRGRRRPSPEVIETGSGGDPFTEAGWTGWLDLDSGFAVGGNSVTIGPCGQTGVLNVAVNGVPTGPPVAQCSTELDQSTVRTPHLSGASVVTMSSEDNRAVSILDPTGALVKLTVPLGEPDSVGVIPNNNVDFLSTGMPSCTANLRLQDVSCDGLVPGAHYTLTRTRGHAVRHARADINGTIEITDLPGRLPVAGGDVLTLRNGARRTLTVLHVAHLRVAIDGDQTVIASGSCQPGDYWGAPLTSLPSSSSVGVGGAAGTGTVCPTEGDAAGLPDNVIGQTDDLSGGQTVTSVPLLQGTAPSNDAIVSGPFTAIAQTGVTGANGAVFAASANVALTITSGTSHSSVFHAASVAGGARRAVTERRRLHREVGPQRPQRGHPDGADEVRRAVARSLDLSERDQVLVEQAQAVAREVGDVDARPAPVGRDHLVLGDEQPVLSARWEFDVPGRPVRDPLLTGDRRHLDRLADRLPAEHLVVDLGHAALDHERGVSRPGARLIAVDAV